MSKLNLLTIGVVILAILAIIFLVFQTKSMLSNEQGKVEEVEESMKDRYSDDEEYNPEDDTENLETDESEDINTETTEDTAVPTGKKVSNPATTGEDEQDDTYTEPETYVEDEDEGDFLVIGGSFKLKQNAENMVNMLHKKGYSDCRVAIFNRGAYASVIVDRFKDEEAAKRLAKELYDNHRIEAYVHKKR